MKFFFIAIKITRISPRYIMKEVRFCGLPVWRLLVDSNLIKERQL